MHLATSKAACADKVQDSNMCIIDTSCSGSFLIHTRMVTLQVIAFEDRLVRHIQAQMPAVASEKGPKKKFRAQAK